MKQKQPRRGAPNKSRLNYRRLEREWRVFLRNHPSLTHEQAAPKFLRIRRHWIRDDLNLLVGGYTRLRNASKEGVDARSQVRVKRRSWHVGRVGISGTPQLLATPLQEAQGAFLLGISNRNYSLVGLVDKTAH